MKKVKIYFLIQVFPFMWEIRLLASRRTHLYLHILCGQNQSFQSDKLSVCA